MSTNQWEPVLKDVISEVLETMFFTMVEFDEDNAEACLEYKSEISIFDNNGRTEVSLCVSREFAAMITANLLGVNEEQVSQEDIEDALREFTNMIGGNYHARMKNPEWSLGIPRAWKIVNNGGDAAHGTTGLGFGCFGEPAGSIFMKYITETGQPS